MQTAEGNSSYCQALWIKAGGRCQYEGCNKSLTEDILTKKNYNQAYIAHIVADVPGGPRGCSIRSPLLKDDLSNLMLLCDSHHRLIDREEIEEHPEPKLLQMKSAHEERIFRATGIAANMQSHIVVYKANIGEHAPCVDYNTVKEYLAPMHYPATNSAIDLSLTNSPQRDRDALFWQTELEVMRKHFNERLKQLIQKQEISHISLFAFAPMPLLIKLGTYLNDIQAITVHQPVRSPKTWNLSDAADRITYTYSAPEERKSIVSLKISLSGTIDDSRITSVLGEDVTIYTISIDNPFNDFLKNKSHLEDFSVMIRKVFNEIKAIYGSKCQLHIFPAMPVATAIELGRVWMPKADMTLVIYDENTSKGGFIEAVTIANT